MTDTVSVLHLVTAVVPSGGRILDIGCGNGSFAARLLTSGYRVAGIEPQERRIVEARANAPGADFRLAGAEALPFPDQSFDAATMIHSLHHVLVPLMPPAIEEALRCLKPGAALIVVEPPPEGSFHEVFKLIDDETAIRNEAQAALDAACRDGILQRDSSRTWQVVEAFADVDELIRNVAAVDPLRRKRADAIRDEITQSLKVHGKPGPEGYTLLHKVQADVFRRA